MIKAEFFVTKEGYLKGYSIKGHSKFGTSGNGIVCAAVSSAAYMTANTITEILKADVDIVVDDGMMFFDINLKDIFKCVDILKGFKLHMISLEEQYPKNIKVNYTEV